MLYVSSLAKQPSCKLFIHNITTISSMIFKHLINNLINKIKNYKNNNHNNYSSFGLLETAITVAIMGTIAGATLGAYNATNPQVRNDLKKMEKIEEALQQFFTINGRLPFPANPTFVVENALYLKESKNDVYNASRERCYCNSDTDALRDCGNATIGFNKYNDDANDGSASLFTDNSSASKGCSNNFVIWGVVPTRSLGLPDDYAYDSQGHNFEYITHATLAYPFNTRFKYSSQRKSYYKTAYILDSEGKYNTKYDVIEGGYSSKYIPMERLLIHDAINDKDLTHTDKNTAYVLLSKGKTGKCFFDTKNNVINTTLPDDATINNCVQSNSNPDYRVNTSVDRKIYQGYNKTAFDNLVRYKTISALMQTNSNIKDKIRSSTVYDYQQYLDKDSMLLNTNSKNIVEAINELKDDIDALQYGTLSPKTSNGANVGLTNVDGSLVKNIALWKPGKYKFDDNGVISNHYSTQLPKAPDGNYYAGELNIYDISASSKNPLSVQSQYRVYEYMTYLGHKWTAKVNADDISGNLFPNNIQIPWQLASCEANWPVGSIYISTSLSTANAVRNKLGCGEWISVNKDKVLWSVSSNANNLLTACVPEVAGWFHTNKELDFTANGNLFSVAQSNGNFALGNNSIGSAYCKVTANFSAYNSIWGACGAGVNTIRPASVAVYMWKRCDGDCRVITEPSSPNSSASTTTLYCPTYNPSTDTGCSTAGPTATNYYKCTFVAGNRSGNCTEQKATKYCPSNNPSTDSGCDTSVSATNHYKCTFVAGNRSGDCEEQAETKYCSANNPQMHICCRE